VKQKEGRFEFQEPTFDEYVAARKVVLYEYELIRRSGKHAKLSIASDEMVASIIFKSCPRFCPDDSVRGRGENHSDNGAESTILSGCEDELRKAAGGVRR